MYVFKSTGRTNTAIKCVGVPETLLNQEGIQIVDKAGNTEYVKGHWDSRIQIPSAVNFPESS